MVNFADTGSFIDIMVKWFKIVNVKAPRKGFKTRNVMCKSLTDDENDLK